MWQRHAEAERGAVGHARGQRESHGAFDDGRTKPAARLAGSSPGLATAVADATRVMHGDHEGNHQTAPRVLRRDPHLRRKHALVFGHAKERVTYAIDSRAD